MRGFEQLSDNLFVYLSPESFVPNDHPLRQIRQMVDAALDNLSSLFCQMYSHTGRPQIPPERLLKAMQAGRNKLLSEDHFSVDGTLIQSQASLKSFKPGNDDQQPPAGNNPDHDFKGEKLADDTHVSSTDPEAKVILFSSSVPRIKRYGTDPSVSFCPGFRWQDDFTLPFKRKKNRPLQPES